MDGGRGRKAATAGNNSRETHHTVVASGTSYELLQLHYMQMMKARKQILLPRAMATATATARQTHTRTDEHMKGIVRP